MDRTLKFQSHFHEAMIFRNYFFMARRMCVQSPLLARLATATSGEPSTGLPLGELEGQEISLQETSNTETVAKRARRGRCTHMRRAIKK